MQTGAESGGLKFNFHWATSHASTRGLRHSARSMTVPAIQPPASVHASQLHPQLLEALHLTMPVCTLCHALCSAACRLPQWLLSGGRAAAAELMVLWS